jgi:hypothetical protein
MIYFWLVLAALALWLIVRYGAPALDLLFSFIGGVLEALFD